MPSTYASLHYHIIFSTKERRPFITANLSPRLYDYLGGIIRSEKGILRCAGGVADHVHLLVTLPPTRGRFGLASHHQEQFVGMDS